MNAAYRKHRLAIAIHLALSLAKITEDQRNFLLLGESIFFENNINNDNVPNFVPQEQKSAVKMLMNALPQVIIMYYLNSFFLN